jgi:hypothetical protein
MSDCLSSLVHSSDILISPLDQFHDQPGKDPKSEDKTSSKLVRVCASICALTIS